METLNESLSTLPDREIKSRVLRGGEQDVIDPSSRLSDQDRDRLQSFGIEGDPVASIEIGRQEFMVVDVSKTRDENGDYRPFTDKCKVKDETPHIFELDPNNPLVLVHISSGEDKVVVGRAIRPGDTITLGREAEKVDSKSRRFDYKDDLYLSRKHASITLDPDRGIIVSDLHSSNGTGVRYEVIDSAISITDDDTREIVRVPQSETGSGVESEAAKLLAETSEFSPRKEVTIDGRTFSISDVVRTGKYDFAVMYTTIDNNGRQVVVPRMLYKSQSDGGWRACYGVDSDDKVFVKWASDTGHTHYTQETKLHPVILDELGRAEIRYDQTGDVVSRLDTLFDTKGRYFQELDSRGEVSYHRDPFIDEKLRTFRLISAGEMDEKSMERIRKMGFSSFSEFFESFDGILSDIPEFVPDFLEPESTTQRDHTLLGEITINDYGAKIGTEDIVWSVAYDKEGRVWIDNIRLRSSGLTSYGTFAKIMDAVC